MRRENNVKAESKKAAIIKQLFITEKPKTVEEMTILEIIEHVVNTLDDKVEDADIHPFLLRLAELYGITERQALLFCICIGTGNRRMDYDDISYRLGISNIRVLSLSKDIHELTQRHLLRYSDVRTQNTFFVPNEVIHALKHNEVYHMPKREGLNCDEIFELLGTWFSELDNNDKSSEEIIEDMRMLYNDNKQVGFAAKIYNADLDDEDLVMLSFFCHRLINMNDDNITFFDLKNIHEDKKDFFRCKHSLQNGSHFLMKIGFIEFVCEDGQANTTRFRLTERAKRDLLSEIYVPQAEKRADVLEAESLTYKEMFYSAKNQRQVTELTSFLQPDHFTQIQERMRKRGFRNGFACLFYGGPGTGKTETVYQLARQSGRPIMVVDVPQIKSKWVGDSEKNIKALFDRYRELVKRSEITPVLLFNEADAIIGKRKNGAENAVDKMENAIQNIILQEMESLDGIMIATTNLEGNLDTAFERRFLYKIHFDKPDATVRSKIWRTMMPELSETDANTLASSYDFSGGQIENIARKSTINSILYGDALQLLPILREYCEEEQLNKSTRKRIGF